MRVVHCSANLLILMISLLSFGQENTRGRIIAVNVAP
jgi:hypothetical protein